MNIVVCIDKMGNGGAERVSSIIANTLVGDSNNNVWVMLANNQYQEYQLENKINVVMMPSGKNRLFRVLQRFPYMRHFLLENKIDIAISMSSTFGLYIAVAKKKSGTKLISSERNDPASVPKEKLMRLLRLVIYKLSDHIVFQTPGAKEFFSQDIQKKGTVIYNPIKDDLPNRFEGERKKSIVMFSRLEPQKNIKMAIDAFSKFSKMESGYSLDIFGRGSQEKELKEYVNQVPQLAQHVVFHGFSNNIHSEIVDAAMYVSTSNFEGISNSMLEALAIGVPTIVTDCPPGGAKLFVEDGSNGFLVKVGDSDELCSKMLILARNAEISETFSKKSIEIRNKIDSKTIVSQWSEILHAIYH